MTIFGQSAGAASSGLLSMSPRAEGGFLEICNIVFVFFVFLIVCLTSYFMFSIAVLPHSPGVVYYHLLLRRETRIPGVSPSFFE